MEIVIASDHGGFELKKATLVFLKDKGYKVTDLGCYSEESVDYPDYALQAAREVTAGKANYGILVCGTGIGMSIAANKVRGIRAALCTTPHMARMTREHNDANILCLGGRITPTELALEIVETFLNTNFAGDRHQRRLDKISGIEKSV